MQNLTCGLNRSVDIDNDEIISFKCELHQNLQHAMKEFVEEHPNWDQYRILQRYCRIFIAERFSNKGSCKTLCCKYVVNEF